jgi:hypothetical protein
VYGGVFGAKNKQQYSNITQPKTWYQFYSWRLPTVFGQKHNDFTQGNPIHIDLQTSPGQNEAKN